MRYQNTKKTFTRLIKHSVFMLNDDFTMKFYTMQLLRYFVVHMTAIELQNGFSFSWKQSPFLFTDASVTKMYVHTIAIRVTCVHSGFSPIFMKTAAVSLFFIQCQCRLYKILPTFSQTKNMLKKEYEHVFPFVLNLTLNRCQGFLNHPVPGNGKCKYSYLCAHYIC